MLVHQRVKDMNIGPIGFIEGGNFIHLNISEPGSKAE
jgi:hypothetical protein